MERIRNKGNSSLLLQLAERVGNAAPSKATTESMNVVAMTMLNHPLVQKAQKMKERVVIEKGSGLDDGDASTESIHLKSGACNDPSIVKWNLDVYSGVKELVVGDDSLQHVKELVLRGYARLESVEIGMRCFSVSVDGDMEVVDCGALKRFMMGEWSCTQWGSFVMKNCGVEEMSIGDGCFKCCKNGVFESLSSLER